MTLTQMDPDIQSYDPADPIDERIRIAAKVKELEAEVKAYKERLEFLDGLIEAQWTIDGTQSVKRHGQTLYKHTSQFATPLVGKEEMIAALQACGQGDCIMLSRQALTARMKQWEEFGEPMPEALKDKVEMGVRVDLRMKKG